MQRRVAIIGIGFVPPSSVSPQLSYKELMYQAALRAYQEAGIGPGDVQTFTSCSEDFSEGTSIFDEYVPDQMGAVLKPVHSISGDGLHGVAAAVMQIATGLFDVAAVEAHSKASNISSHAYLTHYALDPLYVRPLNTHPIALAGLEKRRFLAETGNSEEGCWQVVVKNKRNALRSSRGVYGADIDAAFVASSPMVSSPLRELEISSPSDSAVFVLLASGDAVSKMRQRPIWIDGIFWCNDSPNFEFRSWDFERTPVRLCAEKVYQQADIQDPLREIDFFEVDDTYSYKELEHLEALKVASRGGAGSLVSRGFTALNGEKPVNPSGGSLGLGSMLEGTGLYRLVETVLQLRGEAGQNQISHSPKRALVHSWRGLPTTSHAVCLLRKG